MSQNEFCWRREKIGNAWFSVVRLFKSLQYHLIFNIFLLWNDSMTLSRNNCVINDNTKSPPYFVLSQGKYLYMMHNCPFLSLFF